MDYLKLTKASQRELYNWHPGSGYAFLSCGTGQETSSFFFQFLRTLDGRFILSLGDSKAITLTPDQAVQVGNFAIQDSDD